MNTPNLLNENQYNIPKIKFKKGMPGLTVFGILGIIIAVASAFQASQNITKIQTGQISASTHQLFAVFFCPAIYFAWFLATGIGSLKAKRWARALILTSSWMWLITGVFYVAGWQLLRATKTDDHLIGGYIFLSVCLILIPAILITYYRQQSVKEFCETKNSEPCWTDKCPLPTLAAVVLFATWIYSLISNAKSNWTLPFFGTFVTSYQGMAISIAAAIACLAVAWGLYKQKIWALWSGAVLLLLWIASSVITFSQKTMMEYYEQFNTPEQMEAFSGYNIPNGFHRSLYTAFGSLIVVGYLIYIKKHFNTAKPETCKLPSE